MRFLFVMKHPGIARNLEWVISGLAERGHAVHLAFENVKDPAAEALVARLADEHSSVTAARLPKLRAGPWSELSRTLRVGIDFLRYLEPRYTNAPKLRARAASGAPRVLRLLVRMPFVSRPRTVRALLRAFQALERRLPPAESAKQLLADDRPDLLLVLPLVGLGSSQADYIRAAHRLGLRTAFVVHSWDNLTNKGLLRDIPDAVLVWNDAQATEAVELHGVPPDRLVITGATAYDHWFEWEPQSTREEFAVRLGLRGDAPIVLYLCSSQFIAPDEVAIVGEWLTALRASPAPLGDAGVIVRPHPQNADQWEEAALDHPSVVLWPPAGQDPLDADSRSTYFDSMHHSDVVVGLNTSGLIESAIVGRPVHTFVTARSSDTQDGTLHFRLLANPATGHVTVSRTLDEHMRQLQAALAAEADHERRRRFLETFVRPHGLEQATSPIAVAALERLAAEPRRPEPEPKGSAAVRLALRPLAGRLSRHHESEAVLGRPARRGQLETPVKAARRELAQLADTSGPVIAGPWLAEVGYELLYWIPFLRWAVEVEPSLRERLWIISRGGVEAWYHGLSARYIELYETFEPEELERIREQASVESAGVRKQMTQTTIDRTILNQLDPSLGRHKVLHPSLMFKAFRQTLKRSTLRPPDLPFRYEPLSPPVLDLSLPDDFVAARFYYRASFPETDENRSLVERTLVQLQRKSEVVLLDPGRRYDDHVDATVSRDVVRLSEIEDPATNLAVQSAVIARARSFVGTYGGLSYLPPLLGVPALAVYSDGSRFRPQHLELARRVFAEPRFGRFVALDTADLGLLELAFASGARG